MNYPEKNHDHIEEDSPGLYMELLNAFNLSQKVDDLYNLVYRLTKERDQLREDNNKLKAELVRARTEKDEQISEMMEALTSLKGGNLHDDANTGSK